VSFLEDIAALLNTSGVVVYPGTSATRTCYVGEMPDAPDALVCLYARAGRSRTLYSGGELRKPDLHVEVRAATYSAALSKMEAVCAALHRQGDMIVNGTLYVSILAASEMTPLGKDARNRTIMSQNFEVHIAV
jgi:hypothetical protein